MSTPHKCPKCDGTGWLQYDPYMGPQLSSTSCGPWQCNVCESGIIWDRTTQWTEADPIVPVFKKS